MVTVDDFRNELTKETVACLEYGMGKIEHCVGQLNDQQVWWRYREDLNAIGNLILHLSGNLRQWIIAGIGDQSDTRQRENEFSERATIPKQKLLSLLKNTVKEASKTLQTVSAAAFLDAKTIQGFQVTKMHAMLHATTHFQGHVQEIIYITRAQLGSEYQFQWKPTTKAEGAPDDVS